MNENFDLSVLALANVCHSAQLVQQLACSGRCSEVALQHMLANLSYSFPSLAMAKLAENSHQLKCGLQSLNGLLIQPTAQPASKMITYYVLGLLILERRLNSNEPVKAKFYDRIQTLTRQRQFYAEDPVSLIQVTGAIYTDLISPLGPRIQIKGEQSLLKQPYVQSKIRTALLSGLYSAIWWRSLGGNRLQLIFKRQKLIKHTQSILASLPVDESNT